MSRIGIILNNIGTPESPHPRDVGSYLSEFLMDPNVITLPYPFRFFLVKALIVPLRSRTSGKKYKSIWTDEGSPLLVYTEKLKTKLQAELGPDYSVKIGMRYGKPSIQQAVKELEQENIHKVIFAPLYPQYAEATTGSNVSYFKKLTAKSHFNSYVLPPFFAKDYFLNPQTEIIKASLADTPCDHLLFSYHGLPEDQVKKVQGCLENASCCQRKEACDLNCYKAQCHRTSEALAKRLGLPPDKWSTSFQSRLGPAKWIGPATTDEVQRLSQNGIKRLTVACPAFVTDCLETLEEINIELRHLFLSSGGESFTQTPCLNDHNSWVSEFSKKLKNHRF